MAESTLKKLSRLFTGAVIEPFQRESFLRFITPEGIGDEGVTTWAKRILKKVKLPKMQAAGGDWNPTEDKFDLTSIDLVPYDVQMRITMNRSEVKLFERAGTLPAGFNEMGSKMAQKSNNLLFLGKDTSLGDQYNKTNNQYITKATLPASATYADPGIITEASGGKWDVFSEAQNDAARIVGNLAAKGYNPASSLLVYPEVTEPIFRRPLISAANHVQDTPILQAFKNQGIMGAVSVKDTLLHTAGGATPTVEAFDAYLVDFAQLIQGVTKPESTEVIYDNLSKNTALDAQTIFTPLFIPKLFDTEGLIYKGVSRITAIDANT